MRFFIFFFLVLLPILEILLLIKVGSAIGALNTIILLFVSGFVGAKITRYQGLKTIIGARTQLMSGELPALEMINGIFITASGLLMILPGFITSALGAVLFIPFVRKIILHKILASGNWHVQKSRTFEGEFHEDIEVDAELEEVKVIATNSTDKH